MKLYIIILSFLILSCGNEDNEQHTSKEYILNRVVVDKDEITPIWICNHPGTKQHNKLCIEEEYPNGCFIKGDRSKFCWLLTEESCSEARNHRPEWEAFCNDIN